MLGAASFRDSIHSILDASANSEQGSAEALQSDLWQLRETIAARLEAAQSNITLALHAIQNPLQHSDADAKDVLHKHKETELQQDEASSTASIATLRRPATLRQFNMLST